MPSAKQSLRAMPPTGQVYDSNLPAPILGAFYGNYDRATAFVAPLVSPAVRRDLYRRTSGRSLCLRQPAGTSSP